jgi:hypothetical protein
MVRHQISAASAEMAVPRFTRSLVSARNEGNRGGKMGAVTLPLGRSRSATTDFEPLSFTSR